MYKVCIGPLIKKQSMHITEGKGISVRSTLYSHMIIKICVNVLHTFKTETNKRVKVKMSISE
jgi:hypothetical protein